MELAEIVAQVGLPHETVDDAVRYAFETSWFDLTSVSITYSSRRPFGSRLRFGALALLHPKNPLICTFHDALQEEDLLSLRAIEKSDSDRISFQREYAPSQVPQVVELLRGYSNSLPLALGSPQT